MAKEDSRWMIQIVGMSADGTPTMPNAVVDYTDKNVASWPAFNRYRESTALPN